MFEKVFILENWGKEAYPPPPNYRCTGSLHYSSQKEYKDLQKETVEGCCVWVADEANMLEWNVGIFGPPETIFQVQINTICFSSVLN